MKSDWTDMREADEQMQVHYLTLDLIVKEAFIEELQAQNFVLARTAREAEGRSSAQAAATIDALRNELELLHRRLHDLWTEKNDEIARLQAALSKRPSLVASPQQIQDALESEKRLIEEYRRHVGEAPLHENNESARAAIGRAVRLTRTALARRLRRATGS